MAQSSTFTDDGGLAILFSDRSDWAGGFAEDLSITAQGPATLQGWTLSFSLGDDIQQIWGAQIISHVGDAYVLGNVGYDADVSAGAPAGFGFVASGVPAVAPTQVVLDGAAFTQASAAPIILPVVAPVVMPVSRSAATIVTPPPAAVAGSMRAATATDPGTLLPSGYLSTSGSVIVDAQGASVQINAVNWFGMETGGFAPQGLDTVNYKATMQEMVSLGFNAIRIPFSLQSLDPSSMPNDIDYTLNPDLAGLNALGVLDKIVAEAGTLGLKIILDDHSSAAGSGPNPDGLWYDSGYTPAAFTSDWVSLAGHYANDPTVIGFDLSNEPHGGASWGDGNPASDWELAATQTGDAVQQVNPNALIIVEGIQNANGVSTDWGGNLTGAAAYPVDLTVADRLVYSVHDYPSSVTGDSASDIAGSLASTWTKDWGYLQQQNVAPVLMGEFGSALATTGDQAWMNTIVQYLAGDATAGSTAAAVAQNPVSWAYWDWNPDSNDTGGILQSDWKTPDAARLAAIAPALWKPSADGGAASVTLPTAPAAAPTPIPVAVATPTPTPIITPPPTPAPISAVSGTASVDVTSDWGSGLTASVSVANTGTGAISFWQVELDTTEQITNLWNGVILSHVGDAYVVGNAAYNGGIGAGASAGFGFQATHVMAAESVLAQFLKTS